MIKPSPFNLPASIKQRLLNLGRQTGEEFNVLLTKYALERFLYRIGISRFHDRFILKGALLFTLWKPAFHRATRDADLLDLEGSSLEDLLGVFREICEVKAEIDGVRFLAGSVRARVIREDNVYGGIRVNLMAMLGKAKIPLQIDIGFGDAVIPPPMEIEFPVLLPSPIPRLKAYPREAVIAEKFHATVVLGMRNSRMKDYFDIYILCQYFSFSGIELSRSIISTFKRQGTALPRETPLGLSSAFSSYPSKKTQWRHFLAQARASLTDLSFTTVVTAVEDFLMSPTLAAATGKKFDLSWPPEGPWQKKPVSKTKGRK